jgi:hypothetical protein
LQIVTKRDSACFLLCYFREEFYKALKNHLPIPALMIAPYVVIM